MSDSHRKGSLPQAGAPPTMSKDEIPAVLPILPLRNSVFFPGGVLPLAVGRTKTIALIKDAVRDDQVIGVNAVMEAGPIEVERSRMEVLVRPFA